MKHLSTALLSLSFLAPSFVACGGGDPAEGGDGDNKGGAGPGDDGGNGAGEGAGGAGDVPCGAGEFGPDCEPCTCANGTCKEGRFQDGTCSECDDGLFGENCDEACPTMSEGDTTADDVVSECADVITCEQATGLPVRCGDCNPGFYGSGCSKVCSALSTNCLEVEECTKGGVATICEGCEAGFFGETCADVCFAPNHCKKNSSCEQSSGDVMSCECEPGWSGVLCDTREIIVYQDSYSDSANMPAVLAAQALGYSVTTFQGSVDDVAFGAAYDAKKWDLLIVESASDYLPTLVRERTLARATAGDPLIFSYWDLDAEPQIALALGLQVASYDTSVEIHSASGASFDLFEGAASFPGPISPSPASYSDNGDHLTLLDGGEVLLTAGSAAGQAVGVVNAAGTSFVLGFLPAGFLESNSNLTEEQETGLPPVADIQDLFTNILVR